MRAINVACVSSVLLLSVAGPVAGASHLRSGFDTHTLPASDDGYVGPVDIGFTIDFFGADFSQLYVNTNGCVTFDAGMTDSPPYNLIGASRPIMAPFLADVDTRAGGRVTYGQGTVEGRAAFGVNWLEVGCFPSGHGRTNSFQLVLIDRSNLHPGDFIFEFNYNHIEWESGQASGGSGGMGGAPALVGWSNGVGTGFEYPGSGVSGALLDGAPRSLSNWGRLPFHAVKLGPVVPEPLTLTGVLLACTVAGAQLRRRLRGA